MGAFILILYQFTVTNVAIKKNNILVQATQYHTKKVLRGLFRFIFEMPSVLPHLKTAEKRESELVEHEWDTNRCLQQIRGGGGGGVSACRVGFILSSNERNNVVA